MSIINANLPARDQIAILDAIDAKNQTAATYTTGWHSAAQFEQFQALIDWGVLGHNATIAAKIQQASDATGTGAKDVTGKALATFTPTASPDVDNNNKQATIDFRQEDLDIANGFDYARLSLTVGVATSQVAAFLFGLAPTIGPATSFNAASVQQQV